MRPSIDSRRLCVLMTESFLEDFNIWKLWRGGVQATTKISSTYVSALLVCFWLFYLLFPCRPSVSPLALFFI